MICSHDSLFLGYPAIDIVWRGPVFLALGSLRHLALRGSAWWSPGPGWCSHQSFSWTSVLPFLALTHALTVYNTPVVSALASNPNGVFVTVLCLCSQHCLTLRYHRPVVSHDEELGVRHVPSPPSRTGTSVSALRPCNPLARSLHSCLRFHRTLVPMDDVRCGLRLFLSSCRNPSGRWKPLHVAYPIFPGCAHHWITWHSVLVACHSLIHHRLSLRYGVCGFMPVSLHFALPPVQFPVVVQVHWTPSAFPPYGSVLACAVPAVFYTTDSRIWS